MLLEAKDMGKKITDVAWLSKGGPYSHAVEANGFLFLSGMVPMDVEKNLAIRDDIKAATALVLENIKKLLAAAGSSLENAVKVTVFLTDMNDFQAMNEVYATYFTEKQPARSCVAVRELPMNFPIEIEVVAVL
jgi:2-iminobutanoate/2-iminopropanoate deaminase